MTHLDEKALETAREQPGTNHDGIIRTYLSALPSSPVSELVEALLEWSKPDTGSHDAGVQLVCEQAATTLTTLSTRIAELEREVKRLREALSGDHNEEGAIDKLRLKAFASNSQADLDAYFSATSKWFQDRHYRRLSALSTSPQDQRP